MGTEKNKLSPMMSHYLKVKEENKDCIVFYRLGDFYEMFFEDAIKASSLLDLTLTGRNCGLSERAPMCGVPFHAADMYISKLVSMGEKVAICEQLTEAGGKELVKRDVIKIVSAGTITDSESIDEKSNNFLGSVFIDGLNIAFSWADITTGEFFAKSFVGKNAYSELSDFLVKISPVEIISNEFAKMQFNDSPFVKQGILPKFSSFTESEFRLEIALNTLLNHFELATLSAFNIKNEDIVICSSGALIAYLKQTQKHALININKLVVQNSSENMMIDANSIRNLELIKTIRDGKKYGTLLWLLDKTKTSMGARKLQSYLLSPLNSIDKINKRLDGVESLFNNTLVRENLRNFLTGFKDISRISGKISNNNLTPKDCLSLSSSLSILPSIKFQLCALDSKILSEINEDLVDFTQICQLLDRAISDKTNEDDGEYIKFGYNREFDELHNMGKNGKKIISQIEARERERTGIKTLRIGYNRIFGYYIEITNSFKSKVPYDYERKQTIANAERYITEELKELEIKIISSEEKASKLEMQLFNEIKNILAQEVEKIQQTADAIARLDVLISLATVAKENGYVKPLMSDDIKFLDIVDGRHPVVEATLKSKFIPNDCLLDSLDNRTMIITGPNMAGKSTYMRQIALIVLMAHLGSFVPASKAEIPLVDKIFTRIGASDSLISDQSTFMVEMAETAFILQNATKNSLVILDEIGRGTSTFDGLSIAWSVVEHITNKLKCKTLFATHYHELTELEGVIEGIKNYKITVKEMNGSIIFLRKIMRGGANRSFGIEVAELAGVEKNITQRAKEILKILEKSDISHKTHEREENTVSLSETERIISDIDINNLSPMQAFSILTDLKEKVVEKNNG